MFNRHFSFFVFSLFIISVSHVHAKKKRKPKRKRIDKISATVTDITGISFTKQQQLLSNFLHHAYINEERINTDQAAVEKLTKEQIQGLLNFSWSNTLERVDEKKIAKCLEKYNWSNDQLDFLKNIAQNNNLILLTERAIRLNFSPHQIGTMQSFVIKNFILLDDHIGIEEVKRLGFCPGHKFKQALNQIKDYFTQGIRPNWIVTPQGETLLHAAAKHGWLALAQACKDQPGTDPNTYAYGSKNEKALNYYGNTKTPLMYAAENGDFKITKLLCEFENIQINRRCSDCYQTALFYAIIGSGKYPGNPQVVKTILEHPDTQTELLDRCNHKALYYAEYIGLREIVATLEEKMSL